MIKPVAIVTARAGSQRLKNKNTLPLGSRSLTGWAIEQARRAGLQVVVSSDIPELLEQALKLGAIAVRRPSELTADDRHLEAIAHALKEGGKALGYKPTHAVLLQPTSPFRSGNIIKRCVAAAKLSPGHTIYSGRHLHYKSLGGVDLSGEVWDGCVAVYPSANILKPVKPLMVENEHANTLQIDTQADYLAACVQYWRARAAPVPVSPSELAACVALISPTVINTEVTVVARGDGKPINQSQPTLYLNHCKGYDGGRADLLMLVASNHLKAVGLNAELREVAEKAQAIIIRDVGQGAWLASQLMTYSHKITYITHPMVANTTGALASYLVYAAGGYAHRVGFAKGVERVGYLATCFNEPCTSDELAMLTISGRDR